MSQTSSNNKRIAKNTLLLYFRMLFLMVISLFTSRINLQSLGVEDFGIYNVVGGLVAMFAVLSNSLSASISRFLVFELGKGNTEKLKKIFSTSVNIQVFIAFVIFILIDSLGVWFLNYKMVIPASRISAANWVLQFSIITFCLNLISVPYNAAIIAHEKMSVFAYISIFEAMCKLGIAYLIYISPIDRLIFYAGLFCVLSVVLRLIYGSYCKKHFEECSYIFVLDKTILKQMFGFAGWNFIGASSSVLRDQGGNMLINLFFGPAVNAARGVASQVRNAVYGFQSSFTMAINPQITKNYAQGNYEYMFSLMFKGAKFSYYILFLLSLPIILNVDFILSLWLGNPPKHSALFIQLVLIFTMSESLANQLGVAMQATGKIRNYQIIVGGLQLMNIPIAYVCLYLGCIPETVTIVAIILSFACEMARIYMLKRMIKLPVGRFFKEVYLKVIYISLLASIIPYFVTRRLDESLTSFGISSVVCLLSSGFFIIYFGCTKSEQKLLVSQIRKVANKFSND